MVTKLIRVIGLQTVLFAIAVTFPSDCFAEHYDVYLLAGQSNMDGRGLVSELPASHAKPVKEAILFYRNEKAATEGWRTLVPGFSVPPGYKGGLPSTTFGPEIGFARAMLQTNPEQKLALIKGSQGGTSLRADWNPGVKDDVESQGPQYRDFIKTIQVATEQLMKRGDSISIRGLLWHQGESDRKSSTPVYRRRLKQLIARLREDVGVPDLPVVVGEVFDNGQRDSVRAAIQAVAGASPSVGLVSSDGTTTSDPGTHFDTKSQLLLGQRYAEAMRKLPAAAPLPVPRRPAKSDPLTSTSPTKAAAAPTWAK
ncbi:MAG: sialate O-acetylesterase [Planctomycetota bacterium]